MERCFVTSDVMPKKSKDRQAKYRAKLRESGKREALVALPEPLADAARESCARLGINLSELVATALRAWLRGTEHGARGSLPQPETARDEGLSLTESEISAFWVRKRRELLKEVSEGELSIICDGWPKLPALELRKRARAVAVARATLQLIEDGELERD
mgnify:CR=1 FL=1